MQNLNDALNYFIDYKINERLNNIELKGEDYINIVIRDFEVNSIKKRILDKKRDKVIHIIKRIKFKSEEIQKQVNEKIKFLESKEIFCEEDLKLYNFVKEEDYKYSNNFLKDELEINRIIIDNKLLILYPIIVDKGRKIPLICFEINIENDKLIVSNYYIQCDAMRIIVSIICKCELSEVDVYMDDFLEFINSLNNIKEKNFIKIVEIIENEIASKFNIINFKFLELNKDFNNKAVTNEIVLTLEAFDDVLYPPYQGEIEEVKYHLQSTKSTILEKYLFGNDKSKSYVNQDIEPHFGSYVKDYSINEKQSVVISSYQKSDLLAVSGPPGTGKTTVLKEVIADNIVRKTCNIINIWDDEWSTINHVRAIEVKQSPLKGCCDYSMVIASSNNNAVNNIGVELLNEISYFSEAIQSDKLKYRGVLCAKLGNKANIEEFRENILNPMIEYLNTINDYDEDEASLLKKEFKGLYVELKEIYKKIENYLKKSSKVKEKLLKNEELSNFIENEENIKKISNKILNYEKELNEDKSELEILKSKKSVLGNEIIELMDKITLNKDEKRRKENILNKMNKKFSIPLIKKMLLYFIVQKYGTEEEISCQIECLTQSIDLLEKEYESKNDEYTNLESDFELLKEVINKKEKIFKNMNQLNEILEEFLSLTSNYLLEDVSWNSSAYKFMNDKSIVVKRNKLFELSLKINELYIKKHRKDIVHNLKLVFKDDRWFPSFYQRDYRYNEKYQYYLKAMWETIFLCFPVVTTTLFSLDKIKFAMIPKVFDTILIDEAGQAALHTAIGPLFRFRRALIVGDTYQLEPIHKNRNQTINKYKVDEKFKNILDVQKNSIQHCADRGSDFYDKLGDNKVGIVLTEHRRCEKSIVQFSNDYVYQKNLTIVKSDQQKEFLGNNLCMIDVRGIQKGNTNESELEMCEKLISSLVKIKGEAIRKNIGIITPFKSQANLLKDKFPDIESGTVHVFQGKEKEIIIMSLVVDGFHKGGINFIGKLPNNLNVAFTRAKKQLIVVGNYEACSEATNYLNKAITTIRNFGIIYSIYETDINCNTIELPYWEQFLSLFIYKNNKNSTLNKLVMKYSNEGVIDGPKNHYAFLKELLSNVEHSFSVISPWIRSSVVNEDFINKIRQLVNDEKLVNICFGYNKGKNNSLQDIKKIVSTDNFGKNVDEDILAICELYKVLKDNLQYRAPLHTKALIIDNKIMIIGSHNWLSNRGEHKAAKDELSYVIDDQGAIQYVLKKYELFNNNFNY